MRFVKKILSVLFRFGISIILLLFLFSKVDEKSLFAIIKNSDKLLLFFAFFIFFLSYLLCLFRWRMLLNAIKIKLPLKRVIISFSGGIFFSLFLPSTIGGDLMRTIDLATHTKRPREVIATVFLDRLSGYVGLVILALLALVFGWKFVQDATVLFSIAIITVLLILILLVLFNTFFYSKINQFLGSSANRIKTAIKKLHQEIHIFRYNKRMILNNLIISFIIQTLSPISFYFIAKSIGLDLNIVYFFVFLPVIGAITLLPISIGGLGLRDATTIFFFAKVGVSKDLSFAMSLLSFAFILIYGVLGGIIYVLTVRHRRIQLHKPSPIHS